MVEQTLAIIKPDAVKKKVAGEIIKEIENHGFDITHLKMIHLSKKDAEGFYVVHKDKPFFDSLTDFMSSGKIIVMVLERDNAISRWRTIMGETDPAKAKPGTIRQKFGSTIEKNATHGSDKPETAEWEINYFFKNK
ncbi:MAG: nucleoside-diphosphate kinase [Candidatus Aminicenantaceae bacterium]